MKDTIAKELKCLCELELSILNEGKIREDETDGYFIHEIDKERTKCLTELMEIYNYGWWIAKDSIEEQLKCINEFKLFILNKG